MDRNEDYVQVLHAESAHNVRGHLGSLLASRPYLHKKNIEEMSATRLSPFFAVIFH